MKRVLIITYYWPPSAGSGVQRWLKFSKYLPSNGWQPIIYTPSNPDFSTKDLTLLQDIPKEVELLQSEIWEPYSFYKKLGKGSAKKNINNGLLESNSKKSTLKSFISNFSKWVRGNVFIPDPKVFWVKKSVKYLETYLQDNPVDVIVSTRPPHSMHLIGLALKRRTNLPWIADFRDPWSKLDLLDDYNISARSRKKYEVLEKAVLENSNFCLTVSYNWAKMFKELGAKSVEVITNGYDYDDIPVAPKASKAHNKFIISHFGLLNHLRNPGVFWRALEAACSENKELVNLLEIHIGGTVDKAVIEELNKLDIVSQKHTMHGYITHTEVLEWYNKSSLLLLLTFNSEIGKGNIPGKLFEYLAMHKPIIAFGHKDGDVADIFQEVGNGNCFEYELENLIPVKEAILAAFERRNMTDKNHAVEKYNRENLTKRLVTLLDKLGS